MWNNADLTLQRNFKTLYIMGVDLSCIVRNRFTERNNKRACEAFIAETIEKLSAKYCVGKGVFNMEYDDDYDDYSITTEMWDIMRIQLCAGMWHIECGVHYCQLFFKDQSWRLLMQEIADALGEKELWLCDEYCTWNTPYLPHDLAHTPFEEWLSCISSNIKGCEDGVIPDYPTEAVLQRQNGESYPSYEAYHDTTNLYLTQKAEIDRQLNGFKVVGLDGVGCFIPVSKDGKLYLMNTETKELLTKGCIEEYEDTLNSAGFVVVQNGKRTLYDLRGHKMSQPTKEPFYWEWEQTDGPLVWPPDIIISSDDLNKKWRTDLRTGVMTEISTK